MHRQILVACLPYVTAIACSVLVLRLLVWLAKKGTGPVSASRRAATLGVCAPRKLDLSPFLRLHGDETGAVQSLSFVLTLPLFVMVMLFIVQLSQLTIGKLVVEYAAFAAARSAVVWIPANLGTVEESENRIGGGRVPEGHVQDEEGNVFSVYRIEPGGWKYDKIRLAAAMALMSICPSRDTGASGQDPGNAAAASLEKAYFALSPSAQNNPRIAERLKNKLAYALAHTEIQLEIRHKDQEPPLQEYRHLDGDEFAPNEIGWQDQVIVTVKHDFALLPGPGRLLSKPAPSPGESSGQVGVDRVAERIGRRGGVFVYPMSATVRLSNEGEKPVLPYPQPLASGEGPSQTSGLYFR